MDTIHATPDIVAAIEATDQALTEFRRGVDLAEFDAYRDLATDHLGTLAGDLGATVATIIDQTRQLDRGNPIHIAERLRVLADGVDHLAAQFGRATDKVRHLADVATQAQR